MTKKEREFVWRSNLPELVLLASAGLICLLLFGGAQSPAQPSETPAAVVRATERTDATLDGRANSFDGDRAYEYLKQISAIGPRISGTPGMRQQQGLLAEHFKKLGGKMAWQKFRARHPLTGEAVPMANLLVHWHPDRHERILLCVHYDTRPLPDRDPNLRKRTKGTFLGTNDGASGVALLMELGHLMPDLDSRYGVDFLLVDGEELVYKRGDPYFLGSEWFARQYVKNPPPHKYRWGVVLDMVADADLQIYHERNSISWRETRPLVEQIWTTAARLGVDEFIAQPKHDVRDDHLRLRNIAKIPTCNVIDFDYGPNNRYWHTEADRPDKCSGESLAKVGRVMHEWLRTAE